MSLMPIKVSKKRKSSRRKENRVNLWSASIIRVRNNDQRFIKGAIDRLNSDVENGYTDIYCISCGKVILKEDDKCSLFLMNRDKEFVCLTCSEVCRKRVQNRRLVLLE